MSQAMSHGDTKWKTLSRVEVSRAQLATVSHWPQESWRWRLKKPTRQEGQSLKETKSESTLPPYAGRQAGSFEQLFDRYLNPLIHTLENGRQNLVQCLQVKETA